MKWKKITADPSAMMEKYHVGPLTGSILASSGFEKETIEEILDQDATITISHAGCIEKACQRILLAKSRHEKVFVGGDYDADGICSTAIMKRTLDRLGIENGYYIPDRFKEGYGLHASTVKLAYEKGYRLIITVDNGVKAHEALQCAKDLGMDVIVTDHHQIEEEIEADIVVHPDYMEEEYAFLSGAGVAYQIALNLLGQVDDTLTALCAVALIGDVMPLYRQTRKTVRRGISLISRGIPYSLAKLLYRPGPCTEMDIAFSIVPKLNSIGRMEDRSNVNTLIPFLLSENTQAIDAYVASLNQVNERRKQLSAQMSEKAEALLQEDEDFAILHDPSFAEGICGLVAGRIAGSYHKPVLVMSENGDLLKGSGRSVEGFDLFSFLSGFEKKEAFGGHKAAVGISIKKENLPELCAYVHENMKDVDLSGFEMETPAIVIDPSVITFDTVMDLSCLSPYPKDLLQPYFMLENPKIKEVVKAGKTVRYIVDTGKGTLEAVAFPSKNLPLVPHPSYLVGTVSINRYRGSVKLQMNLEDLL